MLEDTCVSEPDQPSMSSDRSGFFDDAMPVSSIPGLDPQPTSSHSPNHWAPLAPAASV